MIWLLFYAASFMHYYSVIFENRIITFFASG